MHVIRSYSRYSPPKTLRKVLKCSCNKYVILFVFVFCFLLLFFFGVGGGGGLQNDRLLHIGTFKFKILKWTLHVKRYQMVIRRRNSNKDRQCNCQVKKNKKTSYRRQNITQKIEPTNNKGWTRYWGRVSSYWATSGCVQVMIIIQ